jgi:hypothetical protein
MRYDVSPQMLSDLFYQRRLSHDRCPKVGGRRRIPENYLPEIATVIRGSAGFKRAAKSKPLPGQMVLNFDCEEVPNAAS